MSGFTPGPWRAEHDEQPDEVWFGEGSWDISGSEGEPIGYLGAGSPESEANARLIAAAPDLLAEAKYALDFLEELWVSGNSIFDGENTQAAGWGLARAGLMRAIAKAQGEEPGSSEPEKP